MSQPIAPRPGPFGIFVWYWSPVYGWIAKPTHGTDPDVPQPPGTGGGGGGEQPPTEPPTEGR